MAKIGWDEPLPEPLLKKWETFISRLKPESCVTIPRCVKRWTDAESPSVTYRLCGFGDASMRAYAVVVYLLQVNGESSYCRGLCSTGQNN